MNRQDAKDTKTKDEITAEGAEDAERPGVEGLGGVFGWGCWNSGRSRMGGAICEWVEGEWVVSTDPGRVDVGMVHRFLVESYWARGIPRRVVERSIAGSVTFGVYRVGEAGERQVGFARVITDLATFAYLADVFVLPEFRGRGISKFLMRCILAHPELQELRTWLLATGDAHGLYRQFGFSGVVELGRHEAYMAKGNPGVYERLGSIE